MSTSMDIFPVPARFPNAKGLFFSKWPAATRFPSKHFGKEPDTDCLAGEERRALNRQ